MQVLAYVFAPETEDGVARSDERRVVFVVTLDVPFDLGPPELPIALDPSLGLLPLVAVPELTVDEDGQPVPPDNDIGLTRKFFGMGTVTDTLRPKCFAQQQLGLGVFGPDAAHDIRALRSGGEAWHIAKVTNLNIQAILPHENDDGIYFE